MTLRIDGNSGFSFGQMGRTQTATDRAMRKLSVGKRIAQAADDPAGLAIAQRLSAQERSFGQGERNLQDGQSLARTAEASLSTTSDSIVRMRELTVQAQNGTLNDQDRAAIQEEYDQLAAEVTRTAESTSFGGQKLLDGSASGASAVQLHDGTGAPPTTVDIGDQRAAALGIEGRSVADPNTLQALDQAAERVSSARASLGATDNRLEHQQQSVAVARESTSAARSRIEDVDYAVEIAELTRQRILREGQIALQGQTARAGSSALRLLA